MINIVIVDAQKETRDKIASLLSTQKDIKILASGKDGYDALRLTDDLKPDIVILGDHLDFIQGEEIPLILKNYSPSTAVIILVARINDTRLYRAVYNRVSGVIAKDSDMDLLPRILKDVSEGGCFISPLFAARIVRLFCTVNRKENGYCHSMEMNQANRLNQSQEEKYNFVDVPVKFLSKSDFKILACIGEGYTSDEMAEYLGLTVGTVRNNISAVMRKTGLRNRAQMACYAFHYGLASLMR